MERSGGLGVTLGPQGGRTGAAFLGPLGVQKVCFGIGQGITEGARESPFGPSALPPLVFGILLVTHFSTNPFSHNY